MNLCSDKEKQSISEIICSLYNYFMCQNLIKLLWRKVSVLKERIIIIDSVKKKHFAHRFRFAKITIIILDEIACFIGSG